MSDDTNAACAADLRKLAGAKRFSKRAGDLNSLASDIEREDGDAWAGVDLFTAFPSDTGTAGSHPNWVERLLGIASGVSVFAPVAWTWWSFRDASRAYETMLSQGTEADGTSFLSLWATGFNGNMTGDHLLVPMASRSLLLIILAIGLLVAHRMVAEFNVRREEEVAKEGRHELVSALTTAQRIMNRRRADHPQRIEGIIKSSMQKLQMAHDATRLAVVDLTDGSKQITKDMTKLVKAAKEAGEESRRLTVSAADAGAAMQAMSHEAKDAVAGAVASLDATVQSSLTTTHRSLVAASDSLNTSLQGSLNEFQSTMGTRLEDFTTQAVRALQSASGQLNAAVAQIGDSSESNAASARTLSGQIQAMADDRAASADDFARAVGDIRSTLEALEEALTRHESTMQGQTSELTGARDAAERMLRVLTPNDSQAARPMPAGNI